MHKIVILFFLLSMANQVLLAQCESVPSVATPSNIAAITCQSNTIANGNTINNGNSPAFLNNTTISDLSINNQGVAVACGTSAISNNLTMNGGAFGSRLHINGNTTIGSGGSYSSDAIIAIQNGGTLTTTRGNFNNATIVVRSGGTLNLSTSLDNVTIIVENGGTLNLSTGVGALGNVTIVVNSTATLNIAGTGNLDFNGTTRLINYGSITTARNITLQNSNARIFNALNSSRLTFGDLTINNGKLVNYGGVTANALRINNNGTAGQNICMSGNSAISVSTIVTNDRLNSVQAFGTACFRIRGTGTNQLNSSLTNTSSLTMCIPTGMAPSTGGAAGTNNGFGAATQVLNCNNDNLCNQILPVTWVSFIGKAKENSVVLEWTTAYEFNNSHFEIQRSSNGVEFIIIGTIAGAGNSRNLQVYRFVDNEPQRGIAYYRIRQVDFDGAYDYSKVITVAPLLLDKYSAAVADNQLRIQVQQPIDFLHITLIDLSGKVIGEWRMLSLNIGQYTFDLPIHKGFYLLHMNVDGKEMNLKLAVQP